MALTPVFRRPRKELPEVEAGMGSRELQADFSYNANYNTMGLNERKEGEKGKTRWFIFTAFKCNALVN